ncbi:MAG: Imm42 family immunity protein [Sphaerochaeta sp.]
MIVMNPHESTFEAHFEVKQIIEGWALGTFFIEIDGIWIGNRLDDSVDLKGGIRWWRDLVSNPKDRYEPGLYDESKERVFSLLAASVLVHEDKSGLLTEHYVDTFSRFHISQIGMSSFDDVTMLFLKNERGLERLVWKVGEGSVCEAYFSEGKIESVLSESIDSLERAINRFVMA